MIQSFRGEKYCETMNQYSIIRINQCIATAAASLNGTTMGSPAAAERQRMLDVGVM